MPTELVLSAPQPTQKEFLLSRTFFTIFGGARGGGKSWSIRAKASISSEKYAGLVCTIIRKTYP